MTADVLAPIPDDRPLSGAERELAEWMLTHGVPDAPQFLAQLRVARVVARCGCGCASVDFAVDGMPAPKGPLRVLGDYLIGEPPEAGVMIFEQSGVLGGIEVYSLGGDVPRRLPAASALRPFDPIRDRPPDDDAG